MSGDVDPEIWKNKTLGSANAGPFLPEIEAQERENRNAEAEGREPRVAVYNGPRYPQTAIADPQPSFVEDVRFENPKPKSSKTKDEPKTEPKSSSSSSKTASKDK